MEKGYVTVWLSANPIIIRLDQAYEGQLSRWFKYFKAVEYIGLEVATPNILTDLATIVKNEKKTPLLVFMLLLDTHTPFHDGTLKVHPPKRWKPWINFLNQKKAIEYVDKIFPFILQPFKETGRSLQVIITSDHGEVFFGRGRGHSPFFTRFSPRALFTIPFIRGRITDWSRVKWKLEENYWEKRYASGGTSGLGSVGEYRRWKWNIIKKYLPVVDHVIDIGCGDLSFWNDKPCNDYVGIDISKTIIDMNRRRHPNKRFILSPAEDIIPNLHRPVVFCMDLLFHIMDDDNFVNVLENLCRYSTDLIFISTWRRPSSFGVTDGIYQYFRPLEEYFHIFEKQGFKLINIQDHPDGVNALYVFRAI